jgi:hypothetical protein
MSRPDALQGGSAAVPELLLAVVVLDVAMELDEVVVELLVDV